jgi:hypothetical protein
VRLGVAGVSNICLRLPGSRLNSLRQEMEMNSIIYLVGLVVVILFILSLLGLR